MALIAAAVALKTFEDYWAPGLKIAADLGYDEAAEMLRNVRGSTGFVISVAVVTIVTEIAVVIIRSFNIGLVNANIKNFLILVSL